MTKHQAVSMAPVTRLRLEAWRNLRTSPTTLKVILLAVLTPSTGGLAALAVVADRRHAAYSLFMSDPATVAGTPFYTGVVSNLGALGWCAAATLCLFTAAILRWQGGPGDLRRFLVASGALTTLLLFDDLFLFHEEFFPNYVGVPQRLVLGTYIGLTILYLSVFAGTIARTPFLPLVVALPCFALSLTFDQLPVVLPLHRLWEDGFKFLGIVSWLVYFSYVSATALARRPTTPPG